MDMVSESGAITDVNEIAAALGLAPEVIKAEDEAIMAASLEDLLEAINQTEEMVAVEDVDIDVLTPAMESILNIANEIQGVGAISRADAITLRQMTTSLEGFQDLFATMPMNSFTEMPSKVNFDASMEGIFGDIARKVVEIIKAIIKWIRDKAKQLFSFIRKDRVVIQQANLAAAKVSKNHKVVTADTLRSVIEKEISEPTQTAPAVIKDAVAQVVKEAPGGDKSTSVNNVIDVTRDKIARAIPDLYILFYSEKILEKSILACSSILDCCMTALKDNDPVRFFNRFEDILDKVPGAVLKGTLDVQPFGKPNGSARMTANMQLVTGAVSSSQVYISGLYRSFELIGKTDEFECINKIALELKNHQKVAVDLSSQILTTLRFTEDQLKQAERIISSTTDQELLAATQEKASFIQMLNSLIMFVHRRQGDNAVYVGKMAKLVNEYKL